MNEIVGSLGPALVETGINALFGGDGRSAQRAADRRFVLSTQIQANRKKFDNRRFTNRFRDLRKAAEKGGVNFLTALESGYGGGPYWGGATVPGGQVAGAQAGLDSAPIAEALSELATPKEKAESAQEKNERQEKEAKDQLAAVEKDRKEQGGASTVTERTVEELSRNPAKGMALVRPKAFGDDLAADFVRVRMPDGAAAELPKGAIDRINGADVGPGGQLMVEDFEALFGEEGGQVVALPRMPGTIQTTLGGLTGYGPHEREQRFDSRKRGGGAFGGSTDEEAREAEKEEERERLEIMKQYRDGIPSFMKD